MSTPTKTRKPRVQIEHPWYKFDRLLSHNAMWNFAVGGRGIGKTFGCKKRAVQAALERDEEFIYLRRYKDELKASAPTFMNDLIAAGLFQDWDFRFNSNRLEASGKEFAGDKKREWKVLGYFLALSVGQQQKSVAFPKVRTIIFDEFIIEKGLVHYIPEEMEVMRNFYATVDRWQDKTRVYFLANAVSIMNPYFMSLGIEVQTYNTIQVRNKLDDGTHYYAIEFVDSRLFGQSVKSTKFGQAIDGTSYAKFAIANEFADNNDQLVMVKDEKARYKYTLITSKGIFSVWHSIASGNYYLQAKRPKEEMFFTTEMSLMSNDRIYLPRNDRVLQFLRASFNRGTMQFDTPNTRNAMIEIFKR